MSRKRRVMGGIVAAGHPEIRKNVQGAALSAIGRRGYLPLPEPES
jgi:hypothetical protein